MESTDLQSTDSKVIYTAKAVLPTPAQVQAAESHQAPMSATLGSRGAFGGWWSMLKKYGMLKTKSSRLIGEQSIQGVCADTLLGQMDGLEWKVVTRDGGEQNAITDYFQNSILENARNSAGHRIGATGLFNLIGQDILHANQGGNFEITRIKDAPVDMSNIIGVPTGVWYVDADTLAWMPRRPDDEEPIIQVYPGSDKPVKNEGGQEVRFRNDQIAHGVWSYYTQTGAQWNNRHPVQMAWMAICALAASDDYNYSLLTEVIPQGLLDLGEGFDLPKAKKWKAAWDAARQGKKLEDIGLLWGSKGAKFIRFNEVLKDAPYQHMAYWYLTITTGAHGMSPLDIGYMTQLNTKAGAEVSAELSKNKGLARLLNAIKRMVEYWILPPDLMMVWQDLDPTDERVDAQTRKLNVDSINGAVDKGWLSIPQAQAEAVRLGAFEDCGECEQEQPSQPDQEQGTDEPEQDEEDGEDDSTEDDGDSSDDSDDVAAAVVQKAHAPSIVRMWCPICKGFTDVQVYEDHGGLCVCGACECTFDPQVER